MSLKDIYTDKQIDILKRSRGDDWFIMINHGAVRAGKTRLDNDIFLYELKRVKKLATKEGVKKPMYILGGASSSTIHTNILKELEDSYGIEFKFDKFGNFNLFGVYVVTTFTSSVLGIKAIRGMTSFGAYINEASLSKKEVFDEIVKRCSGRGARIICDTNPDHPKHWLKVNYIDKADGESVIANHFTMFDNKFLSKRYVENQIKTTPSGMFTDRKIYGMWSIGEGAVYKDFSEDLYIDKAPEVHLKYFAGVDWGYDHFGSIVLFGEDVKGNVYLLKEWAYQYVEIDGWVDIALQIKKEYGDIFFYADSARPEHVVRFQNEGLNCVNARKEVISGIEEVSKLIKNKKFFVVEKEVKKFKDEVYQYVWHEATGLPVKKYDDVLDAVRYAIYSKDKIESWLV